MIYPYRVIKVTGQSRWCLTLEQAKTLFNSDEAWIRIDTI